MAQKCVYIETADDYVNTTGQIPSQYFGSASLPAGIIVMWSGLLSAIPSGWVLCDGANGTPDLRSRFVKGTAAGVNPGATGGAATHTHANHSALTHTGTAVADHASHTHTYTQVVTHTHALSFARGLATGSQTTTQGFTTSTDTSSTKIADVTDAPSGAVATGTTAGPSATLTHAVTPPSDHAISAHDTVNHEPAYFALAFVMKT